MQGGEAATQEERDDRAAGAGRLLSGAGRPGRVFRRGAHHAGAGDALCRRLRLCQPRLEDPKHARDPLRYGIPYQAVHGGGHTATDRPRPAGLRHARRRFPGAGRHGHLARGDGLSPADPHLGHRRRCRGRGRRGVRGPVEKEGQLPGDRDGRLFAAVRPQAGQLSPGPGLPVLQLQLHPAGTGHRKGKRPALPGVCARAGLCPGGDDPL